MNGYDQGRTDSLSFAFEASGNPMDERGTGAERFLEALEAHAGEELMPTIVHGKRDRKYTRASFAKTYEELRDERFSPNIHFKRPPSPEVSMSMHFGRTHTYDQFAV